MHSLSRFFRVDCEGVGARSLVVFIVFEALTRRSRHIAVNGLMLRQSIEARCIVVLDNQRAVLCLLPSSGSSISLRLLVRRVL